MNDQLDNILSGTAAIKAAPSVAVSAMVIFGIPLAQWAIILTVIYTILMICTLIYDRFIKKDVNKEDLLAFLIHRESIKEQEDPQPHREHQEEQ